MNLTEQELDQWIEQRDQVAEEEIKSILQKISVETMSAIPLESADVNEVTPVEEYWSEPEEKIEVSLHEPDIIITQNEAYEAEKEIDWVAVKERSQIFYIADTFVSDDHDVIESYVLEVTDELLNLKEGMSAEFPKAIDAPFIFDISKREGIT
ncbi:hypothetical protein Sjap_020018 [Stephania japonica]|uniref:Uncharacterized protein n=1 Tax=Stephania japonica TaxID=461633 RepID=A0AAP0I0C4_9MAGN